MLENGIVTLFSLDDEKESFVRKGSFPAWIHQNKRLRNNENGVYFRDSFDVRIGLELLDDISVGDLIFFGEWTDEEASVSECKKIAVVVKNDFGERPHWHLQAEYEYR